jgi:hypothetical protein
MYVAGRWVPENVVSTMLLAWLIGAGVFLCILFWQLRKYRGKTGAVPRASSRKRKSRGARRRRRNGR